MPEKKPNNMLVEYNVTTAAIQELKQRYSIVPDVQSNADLKNLKKSIAVVRTLRTSVEAKRKELKKESLERGRMIDATASQIKEQLLEIEEPMQAVKKEYEEQVQAEKEAKTKAERERVEAIQSRISAMSTLPTKMVNSSSAEVSSAIEELKLPDDFDYQEFAEQRDNSYKVTMEAMTKLHASALDREKAEAELKKQKEENEEKERLAKIKAAKLAEEKAKFEEKQRKAKEEADKKELEQAAEKERLAEERRKLDENMAATDEPKPIIEEHVKEVTVTKVTEESKPTGNTITCPNCGEEIVLPKPTVPFRLEG